MQIELLEDLLMVGRCVRKGTYCVEGWSACIVSFNSEFWRVEVRVLGDRIEPCNFKMGPNVRYKLIITPQEREAIQALAALDEKHQLRATVAPLVDAFLAGCVE